MKLIDPKNPMWHTWINILIVFIVAEYLLVHHHGWTHGYLLGTLDNIIGLICLSPLMYIWHKYITVKL